MMLVGYWIIKVFITLIRVNISRLLHSLAAFSLTIFNFMLTRVITVYAFHLQPSDGFHGTHFCNASGSSVAFLHRYRNVYLQMLKAIVPQSKIASPYNLTIFTS